MQWLAYSTDYQDDARLPEVSVTVIVGNLMGGEASAPVFRFSLTIWKLIGELVLCVTFLG